MTTQSNLTWWVLAASSLLGACGTAAAGTQPHEKSAVEHQAAAREEAAESDKHTARYDPRFISVQKRCDPGLGQPPGYPLVRNVPLAPYPTYPLTRVCWNEQVNPTEAHPKQAEEHRKIAAQHRAASESLRTVEARACVGLTDDDRDLSPFSHRSDIQSVSPFREKASSPDDSSSQGRRPSGRNDCVFRAVSGLTAQFLQRTIDCHLARNAAIGHEAARAEMAYCPLTERGARASVRPLSNSFAVDVQATDAAAAERIWHRAQALGVGPYAKGGEHPASSRAIAALNPTGGNRR